MPKIAGIVDYKPKNKGIVDYKPKIGMVSEFTDRLYEITLGAGMLIGLGPHITYPTNINIISSKSI